MPGIFSFTTPDRLFKKLKQDFSDFNENPSEDGIFSVVFPLYHLREWICPAGHASYRAKNKSSLTPEEALHDTLHNLPQYQVVRELCNNAKHFDDSSYMVSARTSSLEGFRVDLAHVGDSLDVTHFLVDGVEIRDIFWTVYEHYFRYFELRT